MYSLMCCSNVYHAHYHLSGRNFQCTADAPGMLFSHGAASRPRKHAETSSVSTAVERRDQLAYPTPQFSRTSMAKRPVSLLVPFFVRLSFILSP